MEIKQGSTNNHCTFPPRARRYVSTVLTLVSNPHCIQISALSTNFRGAYSPDQYSDTANTFLPTDLLVVSSCRRCEINGLTINSVMTDTDEFKQETTIHMFDCIQSEAAGTSCLCPEYNSVICVCIMSGVTQAFFK